MITDHKIILMSLQKCDLTLSVSQIVHSSISSSSSCLSCSAGSLSAVCWLLPAVGAAEDSSGRGIAASPLASLLWSSGSETQRSHGAGILSLAAQTSQHRRDRGNTARQTHQRQKKIQTRVQIQIQIQIQKLIQTQIERNIKISA